MTTTTINITITLPLDSAALRFQASRPADLAGALAELRAATRRLDGVLTIVVADDPAATEAIVQSDWD